MREVIYPVVGGEVALTDLVNEYRAIGTEYQRNKRKVFEASYANHYRPGPRNRMTAEERGPPIRPTCRLVPRSLAAPPLRQEGSAG